MERRKVSRRFQTEDEIPDLFSCDACGKMFGKQTSLNTHRKTHGEKKVQCNLCKTKFIDKSSLKKHMTVHLGIKKFECDICEQRFTTSTHLTSHMRTHTNERPYKCDICGKAFTVSNALVVHRRIHTGERPYQCTICTKAFMESGKLRIHYRTHSGEKPFKCQICQQGFSQRGNLRKHLLSHSDSAERKFKCEMCEKTFMSKNYLKVHMMYHTEDKQMECAICHKRFVTKLELTLHINYHIGVKQYKCTQCGKEMYQMAHLKQHMRMHSQGKDQCEQCKRFFKKKNRSKHICQQGTDDQTQNSSKIQRVPKQRTAKAKKVRTQAEGAGETQTHKEHGENVLADLKNGKDKATRSKKGQDAVTGTKKEQDVFTGAKKGEDAVTAAKKEQDVFTGTKKGEDAVTGAKKGEDDKTENDIVTPTENGENVVHDDCTGGSNTMVLFIGDIKQECEEDSGEDRADNPGDLDPKGLPQLNDDVIDDLLAGLGPRGQLNADIKQEVQDEVDSSDQHDVVICRVKSVNAAVRRQPKNPQRPGGGPQFVEGTVGQLHIQPEIEDQIYDEMDELKQEHPLFIDYCFKQF